MKTNEKDVNMEIGNNNKGEVVVITGASAGVGRAVAREFAKRGANIGLIARGEDGLRAAKLEVEALGGRAIILKADVAYEDQMEWAADEVERQFGPIDIWVNNAMTSVFSPVKEMQAHEFKRVTDVTYLGQVFGTLAALKKMLPRDKGSIVFVGSALAYRGIPLQSAYCAAKHATQGFFDSLRSELLHDKSNINISMVHLPAINTPQFAWVKSKLPNKAKPMGKIFQPEVAAEVIVYAAYNDRREVYVGLPTVQAIVGDKLLPEVGDWWLAKKGYQGQQTNEPEDPNRLNNLYEPLPGDFGAHGSFDLLANDFSPQAWATMHKKEILLSVAGLAFGFFATWAVNTINNKTKKDKVFSHEMLIAC